MQNAKCKKGPDPELDGGGSADCWQRLHCPSQLYLYLVRLERSLQDNGDLLRDQMGDFLKGMNGTER